MDMDRAIQILGINRTRANDLSPMVKALGMHPWLNTPEDSQRREAAQFVLRRWRQYQNECNRRRDLKCRTSTETRRSSHTP